jgi:hypothetical protein
LARHFADGLKKQIFTAAIFFRLDPALRAG